MHANLPTHTLDKIRLQLSTGIIVQFDSFRGLQPFICSCYINLSIEFRWLSVVPLYKLPIHTHKYGGVGY